MAKFEKGNTMGGRTPGVPNKSTSAAREAIAKFVDGNAHRLQDWLDKIADGIPAKDKEGKKLPDQFKVDPNPQKAFELFQSIIEYHIPKLQRSDIKHSGQIEVVKLKSFDDGSDEDAKHPDDENPPPDGAV